MKNFLINFLILLIAVPLGLVFFYFGSISSVVLENVDIPGKITIEEAEAIVSDDGFYPLYSWYQVIEITPYVIVMSENEEATKEGKVYVNAFTKEIEKNELNFNNIESDEIATDNVIEEETGKGEVSQSTQVYENVNFIDDKVVNSLVNEFVHSRYTDIQLVSKKEEENWGKKLMNVEMWADQMYVIFNFDVKTGDLNELKEQYWKTPEDVLEVSTDKEAPTIKITYPLDGQVFESNVNEIEVKADVYDSVDSNPAVEGVGNFILKQGFNNIFVLATDKSGNVASSYVLVQKK